MPLNRNKIEYDYTLEEQPLNIRWANGKSIFRQIYQLTGGLNESTVATDLHTKIELFISADWTGVGPNATTFFVNAGTTINGILLDGNTGILTLRHEGINLTDDLVIAIVQYTKRD